MQLQVGVKVLIKNSNGQYLFIQRTSLLQNETELSWDIPGGRIDPHEPLHAALQREINEELGVTLGGNVELLKAQDIFVEQKRLHVVRLTYLVMQDIPDTSILLSHEHQVFRWCTAEQIPGLHLDPYVKEIVERF